MLRRALWIPGTVLFFSLIHLAVLSVASRNPAQIWGAVLLSLFLVLWLNRRRISNSLRHIPALATAVLLIVTVADLLINLVPFEPRPNIGSAYRILLTALLYCLPLAVILLSRRRRFRALLPVAGLTILLLPPFSYELNTAFQAPFYGRITGLLYLLLLWRRLRFSRADLILLLPALAAVPALFYGHSPGNTLDHIQIWLLFGAAAVCIRQLKNRLTVVALLLPVALMHGLFVFAYPSLVAVNSNVTAMYIEGMMIFGFALILQVELKRPVRIVAITLLLSFALILCFRMDSKTGMAVILFAGSVFFAFHTIQPRVPGKFMKMLFPAGLFLTVAVAAYYIGVLNQSHSIAARRLVWEAAIDGIIQNPLNSLTGTGDTGPFHLYLFRHLNRPPTDIDLKILQAEPYLISTHPHNDLLFILYSGGLIYLGAVILLTFHMIRNSQRLSSPLRAGGISFFAVMLMHGLTEPFSTGVTTGFLFFLAFAFFTEPGQARRIPRKGSLVLAGLASYLLILAVVQIPVTRFWRENNHLFFALRKDESIPVQSVNRDDLNEVESRLRTLILLAPYESDYYRQAGDVARLRSIASSDNDPAPAERFYCRAFALRSSPLHYASIRRVEPDLNKACQGISLRQDLQSFDPQGLLDRKINGAPLF